MFYSVSPRPPVARRRLRSGRSGPSYPHRSTRQTPSRSLRRDKRDNGGAGDNSSGGLFESRRGSIMVHLSRCLLFVSSRRRVLNSKVGGRHEEEARTRHVDPPQNGSQASCGGAVAAGINHPWNERRKAEAVPIFIMRFHAAVISQRVVTFTNIHGHPWQDIIPTCRYSTTTTHKRNVQHSSSL